jgi:hypothetical protein
VGREGCALAERLTLVRKGRLLPDSRGQSPTLIGIQ